MMARDRKSRLRWMPVICAAALASCLTLAALAVVFPVQTQIGNVSIYSGPGDYDVGLQGPVGVFTSRITSAST